VEARGSRIRGLRFRAVGFGSGSFRFGVKDLRVLASSLGFGVLGLGFWIWGFGF